MGELADGSRPDGVTDPRRAGHAAPAPRLRVGLIGAGRAGTVVARALERVGHHCLAVNAVSEASRSRAATLLPSTAVVDAVEVCRRSDLVIVAVPDDAIREVVAGLAAVGAIEPRHLVLHLSGRHGTDVLAAAADAGALTMAVHPAMTLHGRPEDVPRLVECPFAITGDDDAVAIATALVLEMGGQPVVIAAADRVLYHAALAHASNHLVTLVAQAMEVLSLTGVDQPGDYLRALVTATVDRVLADGDAALTGPIARGDVATVQAHVRALLEAPLPASTTDTYRALARATAARHHRDLGAL